MHSSKLIDQLGWHYVLCVRFIRIDGTVAPKQVLVSEKTLMQFVRLPSGRDILAVQQASKPVR